MNSCDEFPVLIVLLPEVEGHEVATEDQIGIDLSGAQVHIVVVALQEGVLAVSLEGQEQEECIEQAKSEHKQPNPEAVKGEESLTCYR